MGGFAGNYCAVAERTADLRRPRTMGFPKSVLQTIVLDAESLAVGIIWISEQMQHSYQRRHVFQNVFSVGGVVSRKLQLGHRLRALHHGKIATMTKPKKHSKPKLGEALVRFSFQLRRLLESRYPIKGKMPIFSCILPLEYPRTNLEGVACHVATPGAPAPR